MHVYKYVHVCVGVCMPCKAVSFFSHFTVEDTESEKGTYISSPSFSLQQRQDSVQPRFSVLNYGSQDSQKLWTTVLLT